MSIDANTKEKVKKKTIVTSTPKTTEPELFKVILLNDDYSTMDFVVNILVTIFNKNPSQATRIMLDVHKKGKGVCGVYIYDIAITKIEQVHRTAKEKGFPLKCIYEKA